MSPILFVQTTQIILDVFFLQLLFRFDFTLHSFRNCKMKPLFWHKKESKMHIK